MMSLSAGDKSFAGSKPSPEYSKVMDRNPTTSNLTNRDIIAKDVKNTLSVAITDPNMDLLALLKKIEGR